MMKNLLVSLVFLSGCVVRSNSMSDELHTFQAKYVPGDCAEATAEKVERAPQLAGVSLYVQGVYRDGYNVVFIKDGQVGTVADVDNVEFDEGSVRVVCTESTLKLFPVPVETEQ